MSPAIASLPAVYHLIPVHGFRSCRTQSEVVSIYCLFTTDTPLHSCTWLQKLQDPDVRGTTAEISLEQKLESVSAGADLGKLALSLFLPHLSVQQFCIGLKQTQTYSFTRTIRNSIINREWCTPRMSLRRAKNQRCVTGIPIKRPICKKSRFVASSSCQSSCERWSVKRE